MHHQHYLEQYMYDKIFINNKKTTNTVKPEGV